MQFPTDTEVVTLHDDRTAQRAIRRLAAEHGWFAVEAHVCGKTRIHVRPCDMPAWLRRLARPQGGA